MRLQTASPSRYRRHADSSCSRQATNLNVDDRLASGVSLRMFTRSIVIQRRVEDLHLGVESYQMQGYLYSIFQSQRLHLSEQRQEEQVDAY
ncbi:hypothetical protein Tco_0193260 [Tanacetum coccineum]